ncbi:unnamed protein product [Clonostachys rosea]|uniref:Uncharacterized protein n=1 Tax=Bionectria ochroleuca TaxID=29856 RepID=A0ABY6U515_BIOOC|nr:unnamed protein product [Clonostachys rosea]
MTDMELSELQQLVPNLKRVLHRIDANSDKFEKRLDSLEAGFGARLDSLQEDISTRFNSAESRSDTNPSPPQQDGTSEESFELLDTPGDNESEPNIVSGQHNNPPIYAALDVLGLIVVFLVSCLFCLFCVYLIKYLLNLIFGLVE